MNTEGSGKVGDRQDRPSKGEKDKHKKRMTDKQKRFVLSKDTGAYSQLAPVTDPTQENKDVEVKAVSPPPPEEKQTSQYMGGYYLLEVCNFSSPPPCDRDDIPPPPSHPPPQPNRRSATPPSATPTSQLLGPPTDTRHLKTTSQIVRSQYENVSLTADDLKPRSKTYNSCPSEETTPTNTADNVRVRSSSHRMLAYENVVPKEDPPAIPKKKGGGHTKKIYYDTIQEPSSKYPQQNPYERVPDITARVQDCRDDSLQLGLSNRVPPRELDHDLRTPLVSIDSREPMPIPFTSSGGSTPISIPRSPYNDVVTHHREHDVIPHHREREFVLVDDDPHPPDCNDVMVSVMNPNYTKVALKERSATKEQPTAQRRSPDDALSESSTDHSPNGVMSPEPGKVMPPEPGEVMSPEPPPVPVKLRSKVSSVPAKPDSPPDNAVWILPSTESPFEGLILSCSVRDDAPIARGRISSVWDDSRVNKAWSEVSTLLDHVHSDIDEYEASLPVTTTTNKEATPVEDGIYNNNLMSTQEI